MKNKEIIEKLNFFIKERKMSNKELDKIIKIILKKCYIISPKQYINSFFILKYTFFVVFYLNLNFKEWETLICCKDKSLEILERFNLKSRKKTFNVICQEFLTDYYENIDNIFSNSYKLKFFIHNFINSEEVFEVVDIKIEEVKLNENKRENKKEEDNIQIDENTFIIRDKFSILDKVESNKYKNISNARVGLLIALDNEVCLKGIISAFEKENKSSDMKICVRNLKGEIKLKGNNHQLSTEHLWFKISKKDFNKIKFKINEEVEIKGIVGYYKKTVDNKEKKDLRVKVNQVKKL